MDLRNLRFTPGPWRSGFGVQGYYDPREDGPVLAATRYDTRVQLERGASLAGLLPDLIRATSGGVPDPTANDAGLSSHLAGPIGTSAGFAKKEDPFAVAVNEVSVPVAAEGRIYAAFARNWLLTHFPNAYPRWYVDGFGELFSTIEVKGDGQISYGRVPEGYRRVLNSVHGAPVKDVLTGKYPEKSSADSRWTPFHAWGLAHMLFFDEARRPQLRKYLAAIAAGDAPAHAVAVSGDLDQLQRDLAAWDNRKMPYEQMTYPADRVAEPMVRQLTEGEAAFVKGRLELGSRIALPGADAKAIAARVAAGLAQGRGPLPGESSGTIAARGSRMPQRLCARMPDRGRSRTDGGFEQQRCTRMERQRAACPGPGCARRRTSGEAQGGTRRDRPRQSGRPR
jgi:hypothetical protein